MTNRLFARIGLGIAFTTVLATAAIVPVSAAPAAAHTAVLKGQVFADANSSAHADPGEGLRGATLKVSNFSTNKTYRITTGAKGRFRTVVPTGNYYLSGGTKRWKVIPKSFHLHANGRDFALRAVRPLGKVLKADLHFTEAKYRPGDRAHIVITLINTGAKVLRGIGAECDHAGNPNELFNRGPGWGKLDVDGPGVGLNPHSTRTFDVHAKVPAVAKRDGEVAVECDFGYRAVDQGHRPDTYDVAKVPGEFGKIVGTVGHTRHGTLIGLANARLVLVDPDYCPLYTRRTSTNRDGQYRIRHVPAGTYQLYVYPPEGWKSTFADPFGVPVFGKGVTRASVELERGTSHVPASPSTC